MLLTPLCSSITIPAGYAYAFLHVYAVNDAPNQDPDEQVDLVLIDSPGEDYTVGSSDSASVVISEDDYYPRVSITGTTVIEEGDEGDDEPMTAIFTVSLIAGSSQSGIQYPVSVNFSTFDGTATVDDNDYNELYTTVTFVGGETEKTVTVVVNGDEIEEDDEHFYAQLSNPSSNARLGDALAMATIINDDGLDLDIDTDNTNGFESPDRSDVEEDLEDDPNADGKVVFTSVYDSDEDGIADFADGYDLPPEVLADLAAIGISPDDAIADPSPQQFTPLVLKLPDSFDLSLTRLKFVYNGSDPNAVSVSGNEVVPGQGTLRIWTKDGSEHRNPKAVNASSDPGDYIAPTPLESDNTDHVYTPQQLGFDDDTRTVTLFVEAVAESDELEYIEVVAAPLGSFLEADAPKKKDVVPVKSATIDMMIRKVHDDPESDEFNRADEHWLEKELEKKKGAYLPINSDDDDYDLTADNEKTTLAVGENDLLPIELRPTAGLKGTIALEVYEENADNKWVLSNGLRVWHKNSEVTELVYRKLGDNEPENAEITIPDGEIELLVEGKKKGTYRIATKFTPEGTQQSQYGDWGRFNVFDVSGPLNVPDFSSYTYEVSGGHETEGIWLRPVHGTIVDYDIANAPPEAQIYWDQAGPFFGKLRYHASDNYTWAIDVNIVQVQLDLDGEGNRLEYNSSVTQDSVGTTAGRNRLDSVSHFSDNPDVLMATTANDPLTSPAMSAKITVTNLEGPKRDGKERGVRFIDVGFVQTLEFKNWNAVYAGGGRLVAAVEGDTLRDGINRVPVGGQTYRELATGDPTDTMTVALATQEKWYDSRNVTGTAFFTTTAASVNSPFNLTVSDTPMMNTMTTLPVLDGNALESVNFLWNFTLSLAVRTTDGGVNRYIPRAQANWRYNGSGNITGAGVDNFGTWAPVAGTGIGGDDIFMPVTSGIALGIPDGPLANITFGGGVAFNEAGE